ncbi:MAG TPA: hypothetical protein VEK38_01585 [Candidatus Bathyarchaeia archaeon]|nr:hypothetical protein [Candidatus Bathyarchaeia archaeon]
MKNIIKSIFIITLSFATVFAQNKSSYKKTKKTKTTKSHRSKKGNKTKELINILTTADDYSSYDLVALIQDPAINLNARDDYGDTILMRALTLIKCVHTDKGKMDKQNKIQLQNMILAAFDNPMLDVNMSNYSNTTLLMFILSNELIFLSDRPSPKNCTYVSMDPQIRRTLFNALMKKNPDLNQMTRGEFHSGFSALTFVVDGMDLVMYDSIFYEGKKWELAQNENSSGYPDVGIVKELLKRGALISGTDLMIAKINAEWADRHANYEGDWTKKCMLYKTTHEVLRLLKTTVAKELQTRKFLNKKSNSKKQK